MTQATTRRLQLMRLEDIVTTQTKKDGRYDAKINWRFFRDRMKKAAS